MPTVLEDLSAELIYEIFLYFQYDEIWNIFSGLNSRFTAMINNMSFMPIYLGFNGMNIASTEFYHRHLSQAHISNSLVSLCVSDQFSFDNGLWLSSHLSTFINLCHLSLVDIKRSTLESLLNSLSPMNSLNIFRVQISAFNRARYTFFGVPEGVYYERIFRLFPSLYVCHLLFPQCTRDAIDSQFVLPPHTPFLPVQTSLSKLKSLEIRCSIYFLSHLLQHLPQLEELKYEHTDLWLPWEHPLRNENNRRINPINKRLLPNLRHLNIQWNELLTVKSFTEIFELDLFYSLMKFRLYARLDGPHLLRYLLSVFSSQCFYSFNVCWFVETTLSLSEAGKILSDIFQQLKGSIPMELQLSIGENTYSISARTITSITFLDVNSFLDKKTVVGQSRRWPDNKRLSSTQLDRCHKIYMSDHYDERNEEFLSLFPPIVPWHQIRSFSLIQPFNSTHLHRVISQMTNLRKLELHYQHVSYIPIDWREKSLVNVLNDASLCEALMSNGLRQLNLFTIGDLETSNWTNIGYFIVEQLCHLQILELHGVEYELIQLAHILINGLSKLKFLTLVGSLQQGQISEKKLRDLQNSNTRSFRTEVPNTEYYDTVFIWL